MISNTCEREGFITSIVVYCVRSRETLKVIDAFPAHFSNNIEERTCKMILCHSLLSQVAKMFYINM